MFHVILVSPVAEGGIGTKFTLAHLIVSTLAHIKINWPVPRKSLIARGVAEGRRVTHSAGAPEVDLALLQVDVVGVVALDDRERRRRVPALGVRDGLGDRDSQLPGKVFKLYYILVWSNQKYNIGTCIFIGGYTTTTLGWSI